MSRGSRGEFGHINGPAVAPDQWVAAADLLLVHAVGMVRRGRCGRARDGLAVLGIACVGTAREGRMLEDYGLDVVGEIWWLPR